MFTFCFCHLLASSRNFWNWNQCWVQKYIVCQSLSVWKSRQVTSVIWLLSLCQCLGQWCGSTLADVMVIWKPWWTTLQCQLHLVGNNKTMPGSSVVKILTPVTQILPEGRLAKSHHDIGVPMSLGSGVRHSAFESQSHFSVAVNFVFASSMPHFIKLGNRDISNAYCVELWRLSKKTHAKCMSECWAHSKCSMSVSRARGQWSIRSQMYQ